MNRPMIEVASGTSIKLSQVLFASRDTEGTCTVCYIEGGGLRKSSVKADLVEGLRLELESMGWTAMKASGREMLVSMQGLRWMREMNPTRSTDDDNSRATAYRAMFRRHSAGR